MEKFEFVLDPEESAIRIDKFLSEKFAPIKSEVNRSQIKKLMASNMVCDEEDVLITSASYKVRPGKKIIVTIPDARPSHLVAKKIDYEIVFEDDDLIVINKPAGLTVHPGSGNQENTLVNALLYTHEGKLSTISGEERPGIVHRLDKETSGLMLVAKNDFTHQILSQDLQDRTIKRSYLAFIFGEIRPKSGKIEANIARNRQNRLKMSIVRSGGRDAVTNYETLETYLDGYASLIRCKLETGRTHQIRVHLEYKKPSIVGDQVYSSCKKNLPNSVKLDGGKHNFIKDFPRQSLHSYQIAFIHPRTEEEMSFEVGLPKDLEELQKCLKNES